MKDIFGFETSEYFLGHPTTVTHHFVLEQHQRCFSCFISKQLNESGCLFQAILETNNFGSKILNLIYFHILLL